MTRWEPDARGRLQQAALALFTEHGYEGTTVEEVASRAGVTKRTYFRHFPDKREVLFGGSGEFERLFVAALAAAPDATRPLEAVGRALQAAGQTFTGRHEASRRRHRVIASAAELREREASKMAAVAAAMAGALRQRGVAEPAASVAAEAGVAVFRAAYERWVATEGEPELTEVLRESLESLQQMAAGRARAAERA